MINNKKTIAVISLGCDKNRVDTERMLYNISVFGDFVTSSEENAEIIIINTCAFIEEARREAIDTILAMAKYKQDKCEKLIVTGCLPQKHLLELKESLPEVDAFLGVFDYDKIGQTICDLYNGELIKSNKPSQENGRILTTPHDYAYLKIADGCDNHCTYCTIPAIRGKYTSRTIESLKEEADRLADSGVSELILVAQDVTNYGYDLYGRRALISLFKELSGCDIKRIRLLYCYPDLIDDELIEAIKTNDKIVKYLDIPFQHSEDRILKLMGRRGSREELSALIQRLRNEIQGIVIRTTFMVGFPSETEQEFIGLCDFIRENKLAYAGVFAYSREEGTPSSKLKGQLTSLEKNRRKRALIKIAADNLQEFNESLIGKTIEVICEGIDFDKQLFVGRAYFNTPDIDPAIYFKASSADAGMYYNVKITGYNKCDLIGIIEENNL